MRREFGILMYLDVQIVGGGIDGFYFFGSGDILSIAGNRQGGKEEQCCRFHGQRMISGCGGLGKPKTGESDCAIQFGANYAALSSSPIAASILIAASLPDRMQSGTPMPVKVLPARASPGSFLRSDSMRCPRSRWSTPYCAIAPFHL